MAQVHHIFAVWWLQRGQHWTLFSSEDYLKNIDQLPSWMPGLSSTEGDRLDLPVRLFKGAGGDAKSRPVTECGLLALKFPGVKFSSVKHIHRLSHDTLRVDLPRRLLDKVVTKRGFDAESIKLANEPAAENVIRALSCNSIMIKSQVQIVGPGFSVLDMVKNMKEG